MSKDKNGNFVAHAQAAGMEPKDMHKRQLEETFGADFSGVRVHADGAARSSQKRLGATAFATGTDIRFFEGDHSPGSKSGKQLLAHELTHVVQQKDGRGGGTR